MSESPRNVRVAPGWLLLALALGGSGGALGFRAATPDAPAAAVAQAGGDAELRQAVRSLTAEVARLATATDKLADSNANLRERIAAVEARQSR